MTAARAAAWQAALPRNEPMIALAVIVAWLAATAWARPLAMPDEGRYVGVALEMLRSGEWLTPTLDGLPFFHKPPLFYWVTAASLQVFGINEWAARMAPLLGASMQAMALYLYLRRWASDTVARASLLVLLTQPMFFFGAQFANMDMLVAGCIAATVLLLAHALALLQQGQPHRRALAAAYLCAALGVLAKGLIGAVLPVLVVLVWLVLQRRPRDALRLCWLPGGAIFLLVAAPWFVIMQLRFPAFFDYFFVVQHFKRFAQGGFNNVQPFWYYPALLALFTLPWWPWLLRAALEPAGRPHAATRSLMWVWLGVIVLFFSLPSSKLAGYMLPVLAPLSFLIADAAWTWRARSSAAARGWRCTAALAATLCLLAVVLVAIHQPNSSRVLARVLAAQRAVGEAVFFVDGYFYDVPFYAELPRPIPVVQDWRDPRHLEGDSWPKELLHAGAFAPGASAAVLVQRADLEARLCAARVSWVVAAPSSSQRYPVLAHAVVVAKGSKAWLWRVDRTSQALAGVASVAGALQCPGMPNDAPPDR